MTLDDTERTALLTERCLLASLCHVAADSGHRLPRWLLDVVLSGTAVPAPRREAVPPRTAPPPRADAAGDSA